MWGGLWVTNKNLFYFQFSLQEWERNKKDMWKSNPMDLFGLNKLHITTSVLAGNVRNYWFINKEGSNNKVPLQKREKKSPH